MQSPAALMDGERSATVRPDSITERAMFWSFLALLAAAPFLRAGDTPLTWTLLAVLTGVLLFVWGLSSAFGGPMMPAALGRLWPAFVLYLAVVLWAAIQGGALVPEAWRPALWSEAARLLNTPVAPSLSLDPERSLAGAVRLLCYGGVFVLAFQLAQTRHRAILMLRGLVVVALACMGYGLMINFLGLDVSFWPTNPRHFGNLTSTFPERNVFASYAGMSLMAALSLLFRPKVRTDDLKATRRVAVRNFLEYFFARSIFAIATAAVLFCAVLLTHSRAGLTASVAGIGVFLITVTRSWQSRKAMLLAVVAFGIVAVAIFMVGGSKTVERIAIVPGAAAERGEVYRLTIEAIADTPILGTGYGTFQNVFPAHRSEILLIPFAHGHNIYLENALELGVPAAAALVAAVGWIGLICLGRARGRGRESFFPSLGIAVIVVIALHSLVDSTLRAPAVAITLAALLGIASSQALAAEPEISREAVRKIR